MHSHAGAVGTRNQILSIDIIVAKSLPTAFDEFKQRSPDGA